jgi:hypothetical protein
MNKRPLIKKIDIIIILSALVLTSAGFVYGRGRIQTGGNVVCELYVDGARSLIDLSRDGDVAVPGRDAVLTVREGQIAFTQSNCPDKICIKSGYLSHAGQTAVCLPNRVSIKITSWKADAEAPDMVAW